MAVDERTTWAVFAKYSETIHNSVLDNRLCVLNHRALLTRAPASTSNNALKWKNGKIQISYHVF